MSPGLVLPRRFARASLREGGADSSCLCPHLGDVTAPFSELGTGLLFASNFKAHFLSPKRSVSPSGQYGTLGHFPYRLFGQKDQPSPVLGERWQREPRPGSPPQEGRARGGTHTLEQHPAATAVLEAAAAQRRLPPSWGWGGLTEWGAVCAGRDTSVMPTLCICSVQSRLSSEQRPGHHGRGGDQEEGRGEAGHRARSADSAVSMVAPLWLGVGYMLKVWRGC